jgi:hypothetical protein
MMMMMMMMSVQNLPLLQWGLLGCLLHCCLHLLLPSTGCYHAAGRLLLLHQLQSRPLGLAAAARLIVAAVAGTHRPGVPLLLPGCCLGTTAHPAVQALHTTAAMDI